MTSQHTFELEIGAHRGVLEHVRVGRAFAFRLPSFWDQPPMRWIRDEVRPEALRPRLVPLLGSPGEAVDVFGARVVAVAPPRLELSAITSDKRLYREGDDRAHLLVVALHRAGERDTVELELDGSRFASVPVCFDTAGCATVDFDNLPAGAYTAALASWADALDEDAREARACAFTVATYQLAPLTARATSRSADGDALSVGVALETFGVPVDGAVHVELMDDGRRVSEQTVQARAGAFTTRVTLEGDGPFALNLRLGSDPSRTATVPLSGTRAREREATVFWPMGDERLGSLLPEPGSVEIRGVHMTEGSTRSTPVRLNQDGHTLVLTAQRALDVLAVTLIDPTFPEAVRALDGDQAHPGTQDKVYMRGESCFQKGRYEEALGLFEEARAGIQTHPHPYYAYYIACCHAHLGHADAAFAALGQALRDGFAEWDHLRDDPDLVALHDDPRWASWLARGRVTKVWHGVDAQQRLTLELDGAARTVALGAAHGNDLCWEGWATALTPSRLELDVELPEALEPGASAEVICRTQPHAKVYCLIKDARLLNGDVPTTRLAGALKDLAEDNSAHFRVGSVSDTLAGLLPPPTPTYMPPPMPMYSSMPMPSMALGGAPPPSGAMPSMAPRAMAAPAPMVGGAAPESFGALDFAAALEDEGAALMTVEALGKGARGGAAGDAASSAPKAEASPEEEPEVLFAALLEADAEGVVRARFRAPDTQADLRVEVFAVSAGDWSARDAALRCAKSPFVQLQLPPFVHPQDAVWGRVHVGLEGEGRVRVTVMRDGEPVVLAGVDEDGTVAGPRAQLMCRVEPGAWEARVEALDGSGEDRAAAQIDKPGRLTSVARTVRLVEAGQTLDLGALDGGIGLWPQPGLKETFKVLTKATANYAHACCEQTAARMLGAAAWWLSADGIIERKAAEAIILIGVKREERMWLRGRGFKMYPDSSDQPNDYWGRKAVAHLRGLLPLRDHSAASPALRDAIGQLGQMVEDTTHAYKLVWPARASTSCESAYSILAADAPERVRRDALAWLVEHSSAEHMASCDARFGSVQGRVERAYAAAGLLRGGNAAHRGAALELANAVLGAINAAGRLYSTADSVAAIALVSELDAAGILGDAVLEVDGEVVTSTEAAEREDTARRLEVRKGVCAVEVVRLREEDWSDLPNAVAMTLALRRSGDTKPRRTFRQGDAIDLSVTLDEGYEDGDLLWVCLPDALTRVLGGGQVKRFSVDFAGRDTLTIPLVATSATADPSGELHPQRFAVCVRNMFKEERAGTPGTLKVTLTPPEVAPEDGTDAPWAVRGDGATQPETPPIDPGAQADDGGLIHKTLGAFKKLFDRD